jgi:acetyl-CoA acetyltransferase
MRKIRDAVIVESQRTGLAKSFRGSFNQTRPDDMAAHAVKAVLAKVRSSIRRRSTTSSSAPASRRARRASTSGGTSR